MKYENWYLRGNSETAQKWKTILISKGIAQTLKKKKYLKFHENAEETRKQFWYAKHH